MPAHIQSVVVHKSPGMTLTKAKKICKDITGKDPKKVDGVGNSYRFRQISPSKFTKFRAKALTPTVTLVFGITPLRLKK